MTTNDFKSRDRNDSIKRVVKLENGVRTEAIDLTDELPGGSGESRYYFSFEDTVEFGGGGGGKASFSSEFVLTAEEVSIMRKLLQQFRLTSVETFE